MNSKFEVLISFKDNAGHFYNFKKTEIENADWVNGYDFENTSMDDKCNTNTGVNPFSYVIGYDSRQAPAQGAPVHIHLALYYECYSEESDPINPALASCNSCDFDLDTTYH